MRKLVVILLLLITVISSVVEAEQPYIIEVYPAPTGYMVYFDRAPGEIAGVYIEDEYVKYPTYSTGKMWVWGAFTGVLTPNGQVEIKVSNLYAPFDYLALKVPGRDGTLLISTHRGYFYSSVYRLVWNNATTTIKDGDMIITNFIDTTIPQDVVYLVSVTDNQYTVTIKGPGLTREVNVLSLLNVSSACMAFYDNPKMPYSGGIIKATLCEGNYIPIREYSYNDQNLIVALKTVVGGKIVYVVFGPVTITVLKDLGFIKLLTKHRSQHVILAPDAKYYYYLYYGGSTLHPVQKQTVIDATTVQGENRTCFFPPQHNITGYITWRKIEGGLHSLQLLPGEVILFTRPSSEATYLCVGSLDYLQVGSPIVTGPSVKFIHSPVTVKADKDIVVVASNGEVFTGKEIAIPYDVYSKNTLMYITGVPGTVTWETRSIWTLPSFWASLFISALLLRIMFKREPPPETTIKVEWDINPPQPPEPPPAQEIKKKVKQYIDRHGYCPYKRELLKQGIFIPPEPHEKPGEKVLVCPFKVNKKTEKILREIGELLESGFWAIVRNPEKRQIYAYTIVGGTALITYIYKQDFEKTPDRLITNALIRAQKTVVALPFHKQYAGLIIIAEPKMAKKLKEYLIENDVIDDDGRIRNITNLFTEYENRAIAGLIDFVSEHIPRIIIVKDPFEIVEALAPEIARLHKIYKKLRRG